jgi:hypothetical protein
MGILNSLKRKKKSKEKIDSEIDPVKSKMILGFDPIGVEKSWDQRKIDAARGFYAGTSTVGGQEGIINHISKPSQSKLSDSGFISNNSANTSGHSMPGNSWYNQFKQSTGGSTLKFSMPDGTSVCIEDMFQRILDLEARLAYYEKYPKRKLG